MKKAFLVALLPISLIANYACTVSSEPPPTATDAGETPDATIPEAPPDSSTTAEAGRETGTPVDGAQSAQNPVDGYLPVRVASGAGYVDSAQWKSPALFFSVNDVTTDTLVQLLLPDTPSEFRKPAGRPLGLALNEANELLMLESSPVGRIVKVSADGKTVTAIASSSIEEDAGVRAFDSPNDIVVRKDGVMFVTDPGYQAKTAGALVLNRIYRVTAAGVASTIATFPGGDEPNGITLSPDESSLYVSFTSPSTALGPVPFVAKYAVAPDGTLSGRTTFASYGDRSVVDGLTTDDLGNVYVACEIGVEVYSPAGVKLGTIGVPVADRPVHTVRFGGADRMSLFIGMTGGLYSGKTKVPGRTGER
jgi:gluconolactonase